MDETTGARFWIGIGYNRAPAIRSATENAAWSLGEGVNKTV
jgi:hypothetical protein